MDITQVKKNDDSCEYLVHNSNPAYTSQVKLYGSQAFWPQRLRKLQELGSAQSARERSAQLAATRKWEAQSRAIKVIVLYLRRNSDVRFTGKTKCIQTLKRFGEAHSITVSEDILRRNYKLYASLVVKS
jgi:DNA-binding transcriptional regulator YbjK